MMLLIGMKMSFTKKPMKPMIAKPVAVACAIFENSARERERQQRGRERELSKRNDGIKKRRETQHGCAELTARK